MGPWTGFVDLIILASLGLTWNPGGAAIAPFCAVCSERVGEYYDSQRRRGRDYLLGKYALSQKVRSWRGIAAMVPVLLSRRLSSLPTLSSRGVGSPFGSTFKF